MTIIIITSLSETSIGSNNMVINTIMKTFHNYLTTSLLSPICLNGYEKAN